MIIKVDHIIEENVEWWNEEVIDVLLLLNAYIVRLSIAFVWS